MQICWVDLNLSHTLGLTKLALMIQTTVYDRTTALIGSSMTGIRVALSSNSTQTSSKIMTRDTTAASWQRHCKTATSQMCTSRQYTVYLTTRQLQLQSLLTQNLRGLDLSTHATAIHVKLQDSILHAIRDRSNQHCSQACNPRQTVQLRNLALWESAAKKTALI